MVGIRKLETDLVTIVVCLEGKYIVAPFCPLKLLAHSKLVLLTLAVQSA